MITSIHHIAIIVSSEESLEFYRNLGFAESFRKNRSGDTVVLMDGCGIQLEVFIDPRHPEHTEGPDEPVGIRHLALKVSGKLEDELEELMRKSSRKPEVGSIMTDWTGGRFVFVKDYDGLTVELHE